MLTLPLYAFVIFSCGEALRLQHNQQHTLTAYEAPSSDVLPDPNLNPDEYHTQVLQLIGDACGQACEFVKPTGMGKYYPTVIKKDQCASLFSDKVMALDSLSNVWPPPTDIPKPMREAFTMGDDKFQYIMKYKLDAAWIHKKSHRHQGSSSWAESDIIKNQESFMKGDFSIGSYGMGETKALYDTAMAYKSELEGKHCAVLGSQSPWLESILFAAGVAKVTTIEYATINSTHPGVRSMLPSEWHKFHKEGLMFDCVFSYSSLEHAGLGRYGDVVNPWGDFIAMGKLSCTTKPGGLILIGMPMANDKGTEDSIAWNAHRMYGPKRWAQMLANTEQLHFSEGQGTWHQGFMLARKL